MQGLWTFFPGNISGLCLSSPLVLAANDSTVSTYPSSRLCPCWVTLRAASFASSNLPCVWTYLSGFWCINGSFAAALSLIRIHSKRFLHGIFIYIPCFVWSPPPPPSPWPISAFYCYKFIVYGFHFYCVFNSKLYRSFLWLLSKYIFSFWFFFQFKKVAGMLPLLSISHEY